MEKVIKPIILIIGLVLTVMSIKAVTAVKINQLKQTAGVSYSDVVTIRERERQLDCLARNIYHEAASEPFEGKVAVAQVTMNRAASGKFPNDICGVIYQKNVFYEKVVCQFSWYCEGHGKSKPIRSKEMYDESYRVAKKVLLENFRLDVMKEAMYYHADYVNPQWGREKIGKIGRHIFYK
jgi:spore germination cell wall hydrolase CwlJ-like protein